MIIKKSKIFFSQTDNIHKDYLPALEVDYLTNKEKNIGNWGQTIKNKQKTRLLND